MKKIFALTAMLISYIASIAMVVRERPMDAIYYLLTTIFLYLINMKELNKEDEE